MLKKLYDIALSRSLMRIGHHYIACNIHEQPSHVENISKHTYSLCGPLYNVSMIIVILILLDELTPKFNADMSNIL